ncbi:NUMOD1 domain-containing DNA-binding protein [Paracoccus siganidrum]|uniref:Nuclease-associated modular DNA-binding 1 domain-containing protein n=1 Tax=Paracoccus siganidrum TaxID=1276757 RepID=A0A419A6Z1_9RHOB|nr:NUMOD1 domain-containing DNA-binding protein [Paracoccus siganidrum]RJL15284.1 hypothetical protein D3P05_10750 [Paracoccus siganidrum]RMC39343.1 hypothetical protein C9E82_05025 [Paracoccus siganidrum]
MTASSPHSRRASPVTGPDGTVYSSHRAAARALGVHAKTIRWHLDRYGDLSMLGMLYVRCVWRGREYPTMTALSKASGIGVPTIIYHLATHGNLDRLGLGQKGRKGNLSKSRPVRIGSTEWPSRAALAGDIGVHPATVSRWLNGAASRDAADRLMVAAMEKSAGINREVSP